MVDFDADVIVIGAGPTGTTCANLLSQAGHSVLIIEKESFPRFKVGESLLPCELPIFKTLGVDIADIPSVKKCGADFFEESTQRFVRYSFADGLPGTPAHAFQVDRATFDQFLLERACALGARVRFERVRDIDFQDGIHHVGVATDMGSYKTRFLVDASGRNGVVSAKLRSRQRLEGFGIAAAFRRYSGLSQKTQARLYDTGNVTILLIDDGWGWVIPIAGGCAGVGFVAASQGTVSEPWFHQQVQSSTFLKNILDDAVGGDVMFEGDFSYKNTKPFGMRYACVGDASAFLDPVFSSGVAFGLTHAVKTVACLSPLLHEKKAHHFEGLKAAYDHMQHAYVVFGALISRFYHSNLASHLFFAEDPDQEAVKGLISILAGDVWREDNPFQNKLIRSRHGVQLRKQFAAMEA